MLVNSITARSTSERFFTSVILILWVWQSTVVTSKLVYQGKDGRKRMELWTLKNKKAYIVTYTAEADKFKKFFKQADNIIQSLEISD